MLNMLYTWLLFTGTDTTKAPARLRMPIVYGWHVIKTPKLTHPVPVLAMDILAGLPNGVCWPAQEQM